VKTRKRTYSNTREQQPRKVARSKLAPIPGEPDDIACDVKYDEGIIRGTILRYTQLLPFANQLKLGGKSLDLGKEVIESLAIIEQAGVTLNEHCVRSHDSMHELEGAISKHKYWYRGGNIFGKIFVYVCFLFVHADRARCGRQVATVFAWRQDKGCGPS